jgi:hypothetical protein
MSNGPGAVEARIADLLAATRDRALTVADLADNAYGLNGRREATRAQRLSTTRAAHRLLRRVKEANARAEKLRDKAHADVKAAIGGGKRLGDKEYDERLHRDPGWHEALKLFDFCHRIGEWGRWYKVDRDHIRVETDFWQTTTLKGRLYFHPPDVPVEVWAVTINASGVHWFDAEVVKITARNVMARYASDLAWLDRFQLWRAWAYWRGVRFVSSRTGRIAAKLDEAWWERYGRAAGGVPPSLQMPLAEAMAILGVPANYTKADVLAAFRCKVKKAHPDLGGTAEMFHKLLEARDRLLAALGTSAPPPKPPVYAPSGVTLVYRSGGGSCRPSLGMIRQLPGR